MQVKIQGFSKTKTKTELWSVLLIKMNGML